MMELEYYNYNEFAKEFVEEYGYELYLVNMYKDGNRIYELWKDNECQGVVKVTFVEEREEY